MAPKNRQDKKSRLSIGPLQDQGSQELSQSIIGGPAAIPAKSI